MKWKVYGNCIEAWIDGNRFYTTGEDGCGLFHVDIVRNERKQLLGTCQFSVSRVKYKKVKMRKALNRRRFAL